MFSTKSSALNYASKSILGYSMKYLPKLTLFKPPPTLPTHCLASAATRRYFSAIFRPKTSSYSPFTHILLPNTTKRYFFRSAFTGRQSRHGHYTEPETIPYSDWPLRATIAANLGVFLLWGIHGSQSELMRAYFTVSKKNVDEGRWWTALTSMFSHSHFFHFLNNMLALWVLGSQVVKTIGPARFFSLYIVGGAIASYSHLAFVKYVEAPRKGPISEQMGALGASGSAMAVGAFYALLWPYQRLAIFGIIPISAGTLVASLAFIDLLFIGNSDGIGHAAHLGGAVWGVAYALLLRAATKRII